MSIPSALVAEKAACPAEQMPTSPSLALQSEQDLSTQRNAFQMLCNHAQARAVNYLLAQTDNVAQWGDILQMSVLELIRKVGGPPATPQPNPELTCSAQLCWGRGLVLWLECMLGEESSALHLRLGFIWCQMARPCFCLHVTQWQMCLCMLELTCKVRASHQSLAGLNLFKMRLGMLSVLAMLLLAAGQGCAAVFEMHPHLQLCRKDVGARMWNPISYCLNSTCRCAARALDRTQPHDAPSLMQCWTPPAGVPQEPWGEGQIHQDHPGLAPEHQRGSGVRVRSDPGVSQPGGYRDDVSWSSYDGSWVPGFKQWYV